MIYSDKVMDHFQNPRNVGAIEDADGKGKVGNPVCGDMMEFTIKVEDDRITDVKFKTFGCGAAIAVSSIVSEMAMGKTLDEATRKELYSKIQKRLVEQAYWFPGFAKFNVNGINNKLNFKPPKNEIIELEYITWKE